MMDYPRFIVNKPHSVDIYEGHSGERVAEAIKNHIETIDIAVDQFNKLPQIIGLEGEWGSGKSNVIGILKKKIAEKYYVFEYDAWGHQEDLQRRSFLESLTDDLLSAENGTLLPKYCSKRTKENVLESWIDKLDYLLARKKVTNRKTKPKISAGIVGAILLFVFTPISSAIAKETTLTFGNKILISSIPVLIALLVWVIVSLFRWKLIWSELFEIYSDDKIEDVISETISECEPSVREFNGWMKDLSDDLQKKLIIVFDNMDRLPAEKVKELWSSIHTFFSESFYKNIWVIITFDSVHLANAFGDGNSKETMQLTNHFIKKTFPVIYRVAPPIMTDWKKVFNKFYEDAFGSYEDESKETIQRIFSIINSSFTPRDIIAFINELVSLKQTWKNELSMLSISVFALRKEEILKAPVTSILSGDYLKPIDRIVENTEEFQGHISALTYCIDVKLASQIPLFQYVQNSLKGQPNYDINKYSEHKHFISILEEQVINLDPAFLDKAIISLSEYNLINNISIIKLWNELARVQVKQEIKELKFLEEHKILLKCVDDQKKIIFLKYLCDSFRNYKELDGKLFYTTIESLDRFIVEEKLGISLDQFLFEKSVTPEIFISYANEAKDKFLKYRLVCNNDVLNSYLLEKMPSSLPQMDFVKYLAMNKKYDFEALEKRIEEAYINNEVNGGNFPQIIKTYKSISKDKPLNQQLTTAQVRSLLTPAYDTNSDSYFDLVAMGLAYMIIDTPVAEGLDIKIAERLEFYKNYYELLMQSINWNSILLRKALKNLTEKSYGVSRLNIVETLKNFEQIKIAIGVSEKDFLTRLNPWYDYARDKINKDNIQSIIVDSSFFRYTSETNNQLTSHINQVSIEKLKELPFEEIYAHRNEPLFYWHNCARLLINGGILTSLPDNIFELCKKILSDIAEKKQAIPKDGDVVDTYLNKADKRKLHSTIKVICDGFCNLPNSITPELFMFFSLRFDFINKMNSREDDITRNILSPIIKDSQCLSHILERSSLFIRVIMKAGDDAEDLKVKIQQIMETNKSTQLSEFANAIGIV